MDKYDDCPKGWYSLVDPLIKMVEELGGKVYQMKEKFGGLRFYYSCHDLDGSFRKMVDQAEEASYTICQECGQPGELDKDGSWLRTSCDTHKRKQRENG